MQRNIGFSLVIGLLAILAIIFSLYAHVTVVFPGDLSVTRFMQSSANPYIFFIMAPASFMFGGWRAVLLIIIISAVVWRRIGKLEAILIPVTGLLTFVNTALKAVINHSRPEVKFFMNSPAFAAFKPVFDQPNNGFPSGHAFFAITLLGLVGYYIILTEKTTAIRVLYLTGLISLIILGGISRIYMGEHWLSDILGGYLIGGIFLTALIWFHQTMKARFSK